MPNSPVIKFPTDVICSYNHLWGFSPLHYTDEFYKYASEAIDIITKQSMTHTLQQHYNDQCIKNKLFVEFLENKNVSDKIDKLDDKFDNHQDLLVYHKEALNKQSELINKQKTEIQELKNKYSQLLTEFENSLSIWQRVKRYRKKHGIKKTIKRIIAKIFRKRR